MDTDLILALKLQREFELEDEQNNQATINQVNIFNLKKKNKRQNQLFFKFCIFFIDSMFHQNL